MSRTPDKDDVPPPYDMSPSITRSTRRLPSQSEDLERLEPARKKPKNTSTVNEDNISTELEKIHETQAAVLKLVRNLNDKLDCIKSLVATNMREMETGISTVNVRAEALQTSRQAAFLTPLVPPAFTPLMKGPQYSLKEQMRRRKKYAKIWDSEETPTAQKS